MKTSKMILKLLTISLLFISCEKINYLPKKEINIHKNDGSTITVNAEIAKTSADREKGFMYRKNIPDGTGMLFVFEKDQILNFWMKNTPHPLSIAYIDYKGVIRDILDMKPMTTTSITSSVSVRYALEVPQGWYKKNNIQVGDKIDLEDF